MPYQYQHRDGTVTEYGLVEGDDPPSLKERCRILAEYARETERAEREWAADEIARRTTGNVRGHVLRAVDNRDGTFTTVYVHSLAEWDALSQRGRRRSDA